jgi:P-type Cu2+ transporter
MQMHGQIPSYRPTIDPATACKHCELPVGSHPVVSDGMAFCCTSCSLVYAALAGAGMDGTYYRLRDMSSDRRSTPARTDADGLELAELDSETFLTENTREADGGERTVELFLDGVHCAACVWLVERLPYEMEGITEARLDLPRARLTLRFAPGAVRLSDAARWLARFGYQARPSRAAAVNEQTAAERSLLIRMGIAWALAGNVMLIAFALYSGLDASLDTQLATAAKWMSFALAVPAVFYGGSVFYRRAWASIQQAWKSRTIRALHMDTPISLGVLVGFFHSAYATVTGVGEVWFDSITVLIAALLTARWLQLRARRLAGDASERLLSLLPSMARRIGQGGLVEVIRASEIRHGDLIEVSAGEVVPVDGTIAMGVSAVNNAVLTGESRPEPIAEGSRVEAGGTNLTTTIRIRTSASGDETRIGRLLAWVGDRRSTQAPVIMLVDRIGGYFVTAVLALAVLTSVIWLFLEPSSAATHVAALLVITCPCALGMATPLAMSVAMGRAARAGIFVKSEASIQELQKVGAVVLDKTGTLTEGNMRIVDVTGNQTVLADAALLERTLNHPIAVAIVRSQHGHTSGDGSSLVSDLAAEAGRGVQGIVNGSRLVVGRPDWVASKCADALPVFSEAASLYAEQGYTPVAVARDGFLQAVIAVGDALRNDAPELVARLRQQGVEVHLASGDHPEAVRSVANRLGIPLERAHGHVTPEGKLAYVEALQERVPVLMVGDGVNDAAALQAAAVGVAVEGGTTASQVAADVFIVRPGLQPVLELLSGSATAMSTVKRNLGFSLGYNVLGASAAVAGLVTPLAAAVAMPLSSLAVVSMSILQRSFKQSEDTR